MTGQTPAVPAQVPSTWMPVQPPALIDQPVTMAVPGAMGPKSGAMSGLQAVELGAKMGAKGLTEAMVSALVKTQQDITMHALAQFLPHVLDAVAKVHDGQLNQLSQEIKALQKIAIPVNPPGALQRILGSGSATPVTTVDYVSLNDVLNLIVAVTGRKAV